MLWNYVKVALRSILRHKGYSLINIAGLAAGMACCIVTFLYVVNELTYDRYHADADRIYRVAEYRKVRVGEFRSPQVCPAVVPALRRDYPQVEYAARIDAIEDGYVSRGQRSGYEKRVVRADPELFKIFDIPFVKGNPETALARRNTVVITERMASKWFGSENPIGQIIRINDPMLVTQAAQAETVPEIYDHEITGVVKDPPENTHFKYDFIVSLELLDGNARYEIWDGGQTFSYVKLREGVDAAAFEEDIHDLAHRHYGELLSAWGQQREYFLQPVTDIHFISQLAGFGFLASGGEMEPPGNIEYVYVYGAIGLLVLLIGCMNFINLSNVRSVYRAREVGLRKVVGARRIQLIGQFLGESIVIAIASMVVAIALVEFLLPLFNDMAGTSLSMIGILQPRVLVAIGGLVLLVGGVAGGYPAFVLTAFKPALTLAGSSPIGRSGSLSLKILVIGQFAISVFLATGSIAVYRQLGHLRGGLLGFDKQQKLVVPFRSNRAIRSDHQVLKHEFAGLPGVLGATVSSSVPGRHIPSNQVRFPGEPAESSRHLKFLACDYDFLPQYGIQMLAGRCFSADHNDKQGAFVINASAARFLGFEYPGDALGAQLREGFSGHTKEVIGVTADFYYQGMQTEVEPLLMEYSSVPFLYNYLTLTLSTADLKETMAAVDRQWQSLYPAIPFDAVFLDADFDRQYRTEMTVGRLLGVVTAMGLTAACLGLFGLAAFIARARTKEVGIRKVMGASVGSIAVLLSRQFSLLVLIGGLLACPAAYVATNRWLEGFASRTTVNWLVLAVPVCVALMVALLTVMGQSVKAARTNPVEALRHE